MIRLRKYEKHDFEQLFKIDQECFTSGIAYSRAELSSYINRQNSFTLIAEEVAEQAGAKPTIAGFITVEINSKAYGHVITIDVRQQYRRAGVATILMQTAEEELRRRDAFMSVLEVATDNVGALTFYKKFGYNVVRTLPRYYNGEIDGLFMTKRL